MDKFNPAALMKVADSIAGPLKKLESLASAAKTFQFLGIAASPQIIVGTILVLAFTSLVIYLVIEFASKNRFRGISLGIFSKLISLNSYIAKFNEQLFVDFNYIYKYVELCGKYKKYNNVCFTNNTLTKVYNLMKRIKRRADKNQNKSAKEIFISYISNFFTPNPSFPGNAKEEVALREIFQDLYSDKFHDSFHEWLQYQSIWNFVYSDRETSVEDKLLPKYANEVIDDNIEKLKRGQNNAMKAITSEMRQVILMNIRTIMFSDLLNSYSAEERERIENNLNDLFFKDSNALEHGKISQRFDEQCSFLNDEAKKSLLARLNENGINGVGGGKGFSALLSRINQSLSFVDALERLNERSYKVRDRNFFRGVRNLHPHLKQSLKSTLKEPEIRRSSTLINACFQVFNEFIYLKNVKNGQEKFLFLKATEVDNIESNALAKSCIGLFNMHIYASNKHLIDSSIRFKNSVKDDDELDKVTSTMSNAHVSIARLKYLIQDYFVIINEYNDKNNPDKEDIRDFWEKRVNAFGFPMPGTKAENKPKKARNIDYISNKTKRERSDNPFSEDLDRILIKNTPVELYKEYMNSIFIKMRHPKIPFFQSIMATIRYFIPDPNVVIDNFLKQLKGKTPKKTKNPTNYDFSLKYNPYCEIVG
jgi:hypothetical protein